MNSTSLPTDRLAALVARKLHVLELLVRLAGQQLALIESEDHGRLMSLLSAKQSLLSQLAEVERQLDPFRADEPLARLWRTPQARAACRRQAELGADKLAELLELEKEGEMELVRRRDTVVRLHNVHSANDAGRAYAECPAGLTCGLALCDEG